MWSKSPIGKALENGDIKLSIGHHLLGDSAYPLLPYLLTPHRDNGFLSDKEKKFNYLHSSMRVSIEQSFGISKSKFRILNYLRISNLKNAKFIVLSCIILHNFIRTHSANLNIFVTENQVLNQVVEEELESSIERQDGITKRQTLMEYMFPTQN